MSSDDSNNGDAPREDTALDMKKARDTDDDILKLMQGGSAVNLKIVVDDAVSLRNDNNRMMAELQVLRRHDDYAREWISGNYSSSPGRKDHAEEQNDDEKLLN